MSECQCDTTTDGFCERHKCFKVAHWKELCKNYPGFWELYEEGRGPGQNLPPADTRPLPERFPCVHRGTVLYERPCELCGGNRVQAAVYACNMHAACTVAAYGLKRDDTQKMAICLSCDDRTEGAGEGVSGMGAAGQPAVELMRDENG